MTVEIRVAVAADLDDLLALVQRAYRGDDARRGWTHEADLLGGQRIDRAGMVELLDDAAVTLLVADDGGGPVGCVYVRDDGAGLAAMGMLSVDPGAQAGGVGKDLIAAAEAAARARDLTTMEMTVISQRAELIAYYERRGYALTGEERPFPHDERFGLPRVPLKFVVLAKRI